MSDTDEKHPDAVKIKAIDVELYRYALWCTVGGSKPLLNDIVCRRWSEDGSEIVFMLETHNFMTALPDEELELVPVNPGYVEHLKESKEEFMAKRTFIVDRERAELARLKEKYER